MTALLLLAVICAPASREWTTRATGAYAQQLPIHYRDRERVRPHLRRPETVPLHRVRPAEGILLSPHEMHSDGVGTIPRPSPGRGEPPSHLKWSRAMSMLWFSNDFHPETIAKMSSWSDRMERQRASILANIETHI